MRNFMVNIKLARIFKGIPRTWNLGKSAEKFAEMRVKNALRCGVYHININHSGTPRGVNLRLRGAASSWQSQSFDARSQ
jgi:hypothetical protein